MKRLRDGNIRASIVESTRARSLEQLRCMLCPQVYNEISQKGTDELLALLASLQPEELADGDDAGTG